MLARHALEQPTTDSRTCFACSSSSLQTPTTGVATSIAQSESRGCVAVIGVGTESANCTRPRLEHPTVSLLTGTWSGDVRWAVTTERELPTSREFRVQRRRRGRGIVVPSYDFLVAQEHRSRAKAASDAFESVSIASRSTRPETFGRRRVRRPGARRPRYAIRRVRAEGAGQAFGTAAAARAGDRGAGHHQDSA